MGATEATPHSLVPALTDLPVDGFGGLAAVPGARPFNATQVRRWVFARGAKSFADMTDLSVALRKELSLRWRVRRGALAEVHPSADGTVGLLTRLDDGQVIESVSIPEGQRQTLCLSSQVGCAVRCAFCASGAEGLIRNLSAGEILEQVLVAREACPERPFTNHVFMGSGEPGHNLSAVLAAIAVMNHPDGLGIGARRITVSTIGHPETLRRLARLDIAVGLALSVHFATDERRRQFMPGLGSTSLEQVLAEAREFFEASGRRVTVEVVLLGGINDTDGDAGAFARLLEATPFAVNLIPWNQVEGLELRPPRPGRVGAFARRMRQAGIPTTVRRPRGRDVGVACGQLRRRAGAAQRGR